MSSRGPYLARPICDRCGASLQLHHLDRRGGCPWWTPPSTCGHQDCSQRADHSNKLGLCPTHWRAAQQILTS